MIASPGPEDFRACSPEVRSTSAPDGRADAEPVADGTAAAEVDGALEGDGDFETGFAREAPADGRDDGACLDTVARGEAGVAGLPDRVAAGVRLGVGFRAGVGVLVARRVAEEDAEG
jgi:hypothetical protein